MKDRIIFGNGISFDSDEIHRNLNTIVCASPGAGKTYSIVEPNILHSEESDLYIIVSKRRIVDLYTPYLKKRGANVYTLDLTTENGDIGYDPLEDIHSEMDISHLSYSIVMSDPRKQNNHSYDVYWDYSSIGLLQAITYKTLMLDHLSLGHDPNYSDVINHVSELRISENYGSGIVTNFDDDFESLRKHKPAEYALSCWDSFKTLGYKTAGCVVSSLRSATDNVFNPILRKIMAKENKFDFEKLIYSKKRNICFVITSPINKQSHAFCNLFLSSLFKNMFEIAQKRSDGKLPRPVRLIADDFATMPIVGFEEFIAVSREIDFSCTLLIQSESQLQKIYNEDGANTIINCCDNYVFMGANDLYTAKQISERANIPLEDTLNLPVGREIVFMRGHKPVLCDRYKIKEDELYKKAMSKSMDR